MLNFIIKIKPQQTHLTISTQLDNFILYFPPTDAYPSFDGFQVKYSLSMKPEIQFIDKNTLSVKLNSVEQGKLKLILNDLRELLIIRNGMADTPPQQLEENRINKHMAIYDSKSELLSLPFVREAGELQQLYLQPIKHNDKAMSFRILKSYSISKDRSILCDVSTPFPRPYVPIDLRKSVFDSLHSISHAGTKASLQLIKSRYFWPCMDRDIRNYCKECLACQKSKIGRHTKSNIEPLSLPSERLQSVHIDIVGPLPCTNNISSPFTAPFRYVLTCIDRTTRWIEACPLVDITAATVARGFFNTWISRYGVPLHVISDRGSQFTSELFSNLSKIIGFHRLRTAAYHPATNAKVERAHRTIKSAIMARTWRILVVCVGCCTVWYSYYSK